MYAIYGNIYHQYTPNVSIYTIHGSYGIRTDKNVLSSCLLYFSFLWSFPIMARNRPWFFLTGLEEIDKSSQSWTCFMHFLGYERDEIWIDLAYLQYCLVDFESVESSEALPNTLFAFDQNLFNHASGQFSVAFPCCFCVFFRHCNRRPRFHL